MQALVVTPAQANSTRIEAFEPSPGKATLAVVE
jgi:hypothetical protein